MPAGVPKSPGHDGAQVSGICLSSGFPASDGKTTVMTPDNKEVLGFVYVMESSNQTCQLVWAAFVLNTSGFVTMRGAGIATVQVELVLGDTGLSEEHTWGDTSAQYDPARAHPAEPSPERVVSLGANASHTNAVSALVHVTLYPTPTS